jgi:preprotein translocase subunit SecA
MDYENQLKIFLREKNTKDFDEKLISFMIIENEKLYNQTPRLIQIICLLYYLEGLKNQYGLILEVLSGEGKTLIISFLALYFAIFGKKVDILTSSSVLAERDAKNRKNLYNRFGISCDFCRKDPKNSDEKRMLECYNADVVYGDGLNLIGDILRYEFMGKRGRGKQRPFDFIIIDEIDNICIDNLRNIVELIDNFPGFGFLEFLYLFIYDRLKIEINEFKKQQELIFDKNNKNLKLKKRRISKNAGIRF